MATQQEQHERRDVYEFGPFRLDSADRLLWRHHEIVALAPKAVEMLLLFVESSGRVLSKEDLMSRLWPDSFVEEANLSHQVYKLREALGPDGAGYIETIPRRGYRFAGTVKRRLDQAPRTAVERDPAAAAPLSSPAVLAFPTVPSPATATEPPTANIALTRRVSWRAVVPWLIATALAIVVVAQRGRSLEPGTAPPVQLTVELSPTAAVVRAVGPSVVLSPDGSRIAFRGRTQPGASEQIFIRRLDQSDAMPLTGTEGVEEFFFSHDGSSIGFSVNRKLKRIPSGGGDVITLCDVGLFRGGDWTADGQIVFASSSRSGLSKVREGGGTPERVTTLNASAGEITHRFPQVLPDGRTVIFTSNTTSVTYDDASIVAQSLTGGPPKLILRGGYAARYVASGHLLYVHKGALMAAQFDLARLEVTGIPVPVIERIASVVGGAGAQFSVSSNGTLVYLPATGPNIAASLVMIDATGRRELLGASAPYIAPRFSPDGRRLAVQISDEGRSNIWVYDLARDVMTRLTADSGADEIEPIWTADGHRIVFSSDRDRPGRPHLFSKRVDSSDAPVRLTDIQRSEHEDPGTVLSDGKTIIFSALTDPSDGFEIVKADVAVPGKTGKHPAPVTLVNDRREQYVPTVSPDGRWLAYVSGETGRPEVFVRRFPELDGKEQISPDGGGSPTWSPATNELFYRSRDNQQIMVVSYAPGSAAFTAGKPRVWAEARLANFGKIRNFDVHPDGRRIVVVETPDRPEAVVNKAVVHLNFFDELRRASRR